MTERLRIKIAALITALFLGALCTAGVLAHTHTSAVSAARSAQTATPAQLGLGVIPSPTIEHDNYD